MNDFYTSEHTSDDRNSFVIIAELFDQDDADSYDEESFIDDCNEEAKVYLGKNCKLIVSVIYEKNDESNLQFNEITVICRKMV